MKKHTYKYDFSEDYLEYKLKFPNSTTQEIVLEMMKDEIQSIGLPAKDGEYRNYYANYCEMFQIKLADNLYVRFRLDIKEYQNMVDLEFYKWDSLKIKDYKEIKQIN